MKAQPVFFLVFITLSSAVVSAVPKNEVKIIGGEEATRQEFRFAVDIRRDGKHYCSGSIIDKDWILTSAHCATSASSQYSIVAGAYDLSFSDGNEQIRNVSHIIVHPDYTRKFVGQNDIALMLMSSSFNFDAYVQPVVLRPGASGPTPIATVIGWGQTDKVLQKVSVPLVSDPTCKNIYLSDVDSNSMICYGETGKDAGQGDSGGALLCGGQLCGIVSAGRGSGRFPSLYTYVPPFAESFIAEFGRRYPEDTSPVHQTRECGGVLEVTSGRIQINSLINNSTCIWTVKAGRTQTRVQAVDGVLIGGVAIHLTPYHHEGPDNSTQITTIGEDYFLEGAPMFFITLDSGFGINVPVVIEFFSSDLYSPTVPFTHFEFLPSRPKFVSYPGNGENYRDNENTMFLIQNEQPATLEFTRVDMDGYLTYCMYDYMSIYEWIGTEFNHTLTLCGKENPPPISGRTGVFMLIFKSDEIDTLSGFDFQWN